MIDEFALTPDVFLSEGYSNPAYMDMRFPDLRAALLDEGVLVRNLGNGVFSRHCPALGKFAAELIRKLQSRNRLRSFPLRTKLDVSNPGSWCREALATHELSPLTGIIASHTVKAEHRDNPIVAAAEKLSSTDWMRSRRTSFEPELNTTSYLKHLRLLLEQANSFMFVDANLDPSQRNYRDFHALLAPLAKRDPVPAVEIHRVFCSGDGPARTFPRLEEWRERFESLHLQLTDMGVSARIFFWQDFHERWLITDIAAYQVDHGFDTTTAANSRNPWTRIDNRAREEKQRKYDPASRPSDMRFFFDIGCAR